MEEFFQSLRDIKLGTISLLTILSAVVTLLVCLIIIRILITIVKRVLARTKIDAALKSFTLSIIKVVLWIIAVFIVVDLLGVPTASLVAVLSVVGLALSLSVQNIISNLFSGLTLLFTKPFAAGDYVEINGQEGTVESIGLFYAVIENADKVMISIPNSDVTAAAIQNFSAAPARRVDRPFNVDASVPTEKVTAALLKAASKIAGIREPPSPQVVIKSFGEGSVTYSIRVWCLAKDYWDIFYRLNAMVRDEFISEGIDMAYNRLAVDIKPREEKEQNFK